MTPSGQRLAAAHSSMLRSTASRSTSRYPSLSAIGSPHSLHRTTSGSTGSSRATRSGSRARAGARGRCWAGLASPARRCAETVSGWSPGRWSRSRQPFAAPTDGRGHRHRSRRAPILVVPAMAHTASGGAVGITDLTPSPPLQQSQPFQQSQPPRRHCDLPAPRRLPGDARAAASAQPRPRDPGLEFDDDPGERRPTGTSWPPAGCPQRRRPWSTSPVAWPPWSATAVPVRSIPAVRRAVDEALGGR